MTAINFSLIKQRTLYHSIYMYIKQLTSGKSKLCLSVLQHREDNEYYSTERNTAFHERNRREYQHCPELYSITDR